MNCKIVKNTDGKINQVLDQSGNPSSLFKQILNVPTLTLDEAIDAYKNIYSEKLQGKVKYQIIGEKEASRIEQYKQSLDRAKELESQGKSIEEIENQTGWFKNKQGQWKYFSNEYIQQFSLKDDYLNIKNKPQTVKDIIKDNIILQAYPELKDLKVLFYDKTFKNLPREVGETNGFYNEGEETLYINMDNRDGKSLGSIFSHELAHHLQKLEGFSTGGGLNSILIYAMHLTGASKIKFSDLLNYWNTYDTIGLNTDEKNVLEQAKKAYVNYKKKDDVALMYQYDRIQGEIDARAVELALKLKNEFGDLTYKELTDKIKSTEEIDEAQIVDLFYKGFSYANPTQNKNSEILDQLKKTGLAKNVYTLSNSEIEAKLSELGEENVNKNTSGFTYNGDIYLNSEKQAEDTLLHEYSYIFRDFLKQNRKEVFDKGLSLIEAELKLGEKSKIKNIFYYVKSTQPNLTGEAKAEEILVQLLGVRGIELINSNKKGGIIDWISEAWAQIKELLGLSQYSNEEIQKMTLEQYVEATNVQLLSGNSIADKVNEYLSRLNKIKEEDPTNYWSVDVPSLEIVKDAVQNDRLAEVEGGMGIVTTDGNLIGLFKDNLNAKNVAKDLQEIRVKKGGYKLDNFDGKLTKIYEKNGFRVVSRLAFNEEMVSDLKGYDKKLHGTPDVVFMIYDPNNSFKIKEKSFNKDQYDQAKAYRDSFSEEAKANTPFYQKSNFVSGGAAFAKFFAKITNTKDGGAQFKGLEHYLNKSVEGLEEELKAYFMYGGNFQKHIVASIPGFLDARIRMLKGMADASIVLGRGGNEVKMLDITSSEGYFTKAWAQLAQDKGINAKADALDAGVSMQRDFNETPQVAGVEFLLEAWGETFVDPESGINIPLFVPTKKYEIIHENMGFQFFTPTRDKEIKEVKAMLSEGGLFVTAEKLKNEDYARREVLKDQFKAESFTAEEIAEKAKTVLKESDEASVGMMDYQFDRLEYEKVLSNNFKYVVQMYSAGNFAGYYASDSLEVIEAALRGTGDTTTKYNEEATPKIIKDKSSEISLGAKQIAIEPNLSFEIPNGEIFDNYSEALKNTDEGTIKLKIDDVVIGEVSSSTDISTVVGSINDLVKQNILKGERLLNPNGTVSLVTEGNSLAKKLINASISEELFLGNKVKPSVDERGDVSLAEKQSFYEEVKNLDYKQIKSKHGTDVANIVLAARIYEENTKAYGQKRFIEDVQEIIPENELQEQLLNLLNTLGVKTVSLKRYNESYKERNGVLPSANALADIANRVIAFTNGEVTQDELTEEVSHFILEAVNQDELVPLLENIHKTDEWAQYAEEYFNIYQDEAIVRKEILGKVLKNAIQRNFEKSQQTGTANTIIGKLEEIFDKFFTRISEFFTPQHRIDLDEYTKKIYDNLMLGGLVDELNQEQLEGNNLILFQTSKNIQSEADLLLSKLNKVLEQVEAQDRRLNSVSKEEILTIKEALKVVDIDNEEAEIARATLSISNIANRQINYLVKRDKRNLLSSEESAVFSLTVGYLYKVLTELESIIGKKTVFPNKVLITKELSRTLESIRKLQGDVAISQEQNVERIFDKVSEELDLDDTTKKQLLDNFNNITRDTNVFYAYVGGAINAHNPALNIASALISKAYADRDMAFNIKAKEFTNLAKSKGYTEEELSGLMKKWKRGHHLFSRFDFEKAEKDMLDEKVKLFKEVFGKEVTADQLLKNEDTLLKAEVIDTKKIYYKKVNDFRQENQVYSPLTEEETRKSNAIYAQVSLETQMKDKELSRQRSAITREAKRNGSFSEAQKFEMEELVRKRAKLKNPFDNQGKLKAGLNLNEDDEIVIADGFDVNTLEAESKEVYELNLLDKLKTENFKNSLQETALPQKFIDALNAIKGYDEKLDFIKLNANISFSSDFWNTFDRSEGVASKLREKGEYALADAIQQLTIRRKHLLKASRVFNNPSETDYEDLSGETILSLIEIESKLELNYNAANKILDKKDRVRNEMSESVVNQAYKNEIEDGDIQTTNERIDFIKKHVTDANKNKIEIARLAVDAYRKGLRKDLPKALQPFISSEKELDVEEVLTAYAETKLASYFKKLQPVGFSYDALLAEIASDPNSFFKNMSKDVSVSPNYIFLGQEENKRVNPKFAKNIEEGEPQLQLYDKSGNIKYGNKEFADYFGIVNLESPQATKNQKEYELLQALYKFQDDTIDKADMKDKHSRYLLPQKRPETLARIANIKADNKGNLKEGFKELFSYREDDAIYGQTDGQMRIGVASATGKMTIPRHGFNRIQTTEEVTDELLYSYMWMAQEAELRKSRVGILGDIESIRTILTNKSYGDKHGEATATYNMFDDFVRFNMYGQSESFSFETNFGILSKKVNLAPLVKKFQWWIRLVNLGFSVLTPLTSFLQGSVNFQIEKFVGERIDKDASRLARKQLVKLLPETMSDVMKITSSSKLNIISEFMGQDSSLERFKNSNYSRLTRGMASSAYMTHAAADVPLSAQVMLTVLHDFRVVNGRLMTFAKFAEENKSKTRKEARLAWAAYEDEALFNYIKIENGVASITDELRNKVPDIDKRMQNVRNSISVAKQEVDSQIPSVDRTKMQRHALLSFLTLHKGWLITSMTRRFKSKHLNLYTGLEEEGSYSGTFGSDSFFSDLVQSWKKEGVSFKAVKENWENSSLTRRRSITRVASDIVVTNALVLVALLLKGAADGDDDKDYATQFAAYMSYRLAVEVTSQSTSFSNQVYKFLESPSTGLTQIQNVLDITDLTSSDIVESGTYKGLAKSEAWLFKSLPALKEYFKVKNIEKTKKSFEFYNAPTINYFTVAGALMKEEKEE